MAQRKKPASRAKRGTKRKPSPARDNRGASVVLFGVGLVLLVLALVPGQSVWLWLHNVQRGLLGLCSWLVGPFLMYLAVCMARVQKLAPPLIKGILVMLFASGTSLVFSPTYFEGMTGVQVIAALYDTGSSALGGGVLGIFGYLLLALCGRPAANLLLLVLLIVALMLFTGVTPSEVSDWTKARAAGVGRSAREFATDQSERAAVRRAERAQRRLDAQAQEPDAPPHRSQSIREMDAQIADDHWAGETAESAEPDAKNDPLAAVRHLFRRPSVDIPLDDAPVQQEPPEETPAAPAEEPAPAPAPADTPAQPEDEIVRLIRKAVNAGEKPAQPAAPQPEPEPEQPAAEPQEPSAYQYPPIDLFQAARDPDEKGVQEEMRRNADTLVNTLESFGVKTRVLDISRGPAVTRYELQPLAGVKISRITGLSDDIALNLATAGVRIEAPIPGKPAVGVEIPNKHRATVSLRSVLESPAFNQSRAPLTFALGKDITGNCQVGNLAKMPHLLIAGTTGSGKSVCTNSIILSFLYRCSPKVLRMILIDPKMVEFAHYNGIPHLLMPVVTEPRKAAGALGTAVAEMEKRYYLLAENGVPNIEEYNALAEIDDSLEKMPYIVIVIDELADLMMVAGKEVEDYICRLAQKARAAGMHLIIATQRPSVDVITGLIKANIPSRVALSVMSQVDSRTILDTAGAEKLLGYGDMLYMPVGVNKPVRVQGTFVSSGEIRAVIEFIKSNSSSDYSQEMIEEMEKRAVPEKNAESSSDDGNDTDPMFKTAVEVVIDAGQASTSLLQRRCKLGYARAARIMDEMEQLHIIGPYEGAKPRQVLITRQQWIEMTMNNDPVPDEI